MPHSRPSLLLRLGLVLLLAPAALRAQLDPRLQTSNTDFLDLYQQSTSLKARPEIVSIFDFSRSMASLMFHPLYRNDDVSDADDYRYMKFQLTDAGGGSAPNNRWWIIGRAGNDSNAYTRSYVTVNPDGTATLTFWDNPASCRNIGGNGLCNYTTGNNIPGNFYVTAQSIGNGGAWSRAYFNPVSTAPLPVGVNDHTNYSLGSNTTTGSFGSPSYTMSTFTVTPAGPWSPGTVVTVTAVLNHPWTEGEDITHRNINMWLSGGPGFSTGPTWSQIDASNFQVTGTFVVPDFVHTTTVTGDRTQLAAIQATPASPFGAAATIALKSYFLTQGTGANNDKINWTVSPVDTTNYCGNGIPAITAQTTADTTGYAAATGASFTIPAYNSCANTGATAPYVTVTLDASVGSAYNGGLAYPGVLSQNTSAAAPYEVLRKPDGTAVTQADAAAASGSLEGATLGVRDVRNWIRAASHVRFKSGTRTIDIPIPWKIMNAASTGTPLSSTTILDQQVKTVGGVSTTYGSGLNIEPDTCYKVENYANGMFTADTNGTTPPLGNILANRAVTVFLYGVAYRPAYVAWLFNGKYQSGNAANPNYTPRAALVGKYVAFDAVDDTKAYGQSTHAAWGQGFGPAGAAWGALDLIPQYDSVGTYTGDASVDASRFATPALSRVQANKQAAITTWINHQADVLWAFRNLDIVNEAGGGSGTTIDNNSATTKAAGDPTAIHIDGLDSGWTVLNNTDAQGITSTTGNSVTGMKRIAALFPNGQTPLTYAVARALAQFNDPNSVFNPIVGANVSQCVNQFLLLFTDGIDNNGTGTNNASAATPYVTGSGAGMALNALTGNQAVITDNSLVNRSGASWNFFTFSALAAHLSDPALGTLGTDYLKGADPGSSTSTGTPSAFLPFSVKKRNGILYDKDHRVTTMTIGVSLGGKYTDATSPKRSLFLAAVVGDPATNSGLLTSFHTFVPPVLDGSGNVITQNDWLPDPQDLSEYPSVGVRATGAVYFFDATDPAKLVTSMDYAFRIAISSGGNNATASPNIPFIGASLGKQIYIGQFQPPKAGGVVWSGDLMSFGTRETGGTISIIDTAGNVTTTLDSTTAIWSAASRLSALTWANRKLFTRLPGTGALPERGLHPFVDQTAAYTAADAADNSAGLQWYAATALGAGSAAQKAAIQNAMGGNTLGPVDGFGRPTTSRLNLMGDIIDSAPAVLEYKISDASIATGIGASAPLAAVGGSRFRTVLVGDNQGWLHCFGEVTKSSTVTVGGVSYDIAQGAVDELWAFMPTDFLAKLDYAYGASVGTNTHRFMVDGSPNIYFLDLPPSGGGSGNGLLDNGSGSQERAIAIVGLRKGGRSYYAINIKDPFNPVLQWSLVPDEAALFPASRNLTGLALATLQDIIARMGFSTSAPALGRVAFTYAGTTRLRDVVFLGGGHSVPEVEANFLDGAGKTMLLGRSVLTVDAYTGEVLAAVDMTSLPGVTTTLGNPSTCSVGPIPAGLVPFEFILNSGMAQRAYFLDFNGGLWAWGSKAVADASAGGLENYRIDTSDLAAWTSDGTTSGSVGIRKVAQDGTGYNALYSTLPAPFRVGDFPGRGKSGNPAPAAVGVAMVSGNRYNPVDFLYVSGTKPTYHRLTVVFDRQDSRVWGLDTASGPDTAIQDSDLKNFTGNTVSSGPASLCPGGLWSLITPGCPEFYLAPSVGSPSFGYFVQFPGVDAKGFVPKGLTPPMVVAGSLFYSYFWPSTADPCTGGTGTTYSSLIPDAVSAIVTDNRTGIVPKAGTVAQWSGVASEYISFGTRGVIQGGTVPVVNPPVGGPTTTVSLQTQRGRTGEVYPKARIWRTVR